MTFFSNFQASGGPGFNGLSNIKMEDGMGPTMGGVKVGRFYFEFKLLKFIKRGNLRWTDECQILKRYL